MSSNSFHLTSLRSRLKPYRLHFFPRLRSTSDHAAILRRRGDLYAPAVVLTSRQIAGRGRGTNTWFSAGGCVTATFAFPIDERFAPHQIPLIAGLAVRRAAVELTGERDIQLKWPNDLLFRGRKLAGLLCERLHKADFVGLGLNVNLNPRAASPPLRNRLMSLSAITGRAIDVNDALVSAAAHLRGLLTHRDEQPFAALLREYDQHHALLGQRVSVASAGATVTGRCQGLDSAGRLLLKQGKTVHRVIAGEVRVVGG